MSRIHRRKRSRERRPAPSPSGPRWWHYLLVGLIAAAAIALAAAALMQDHSPPRPGDRTVSLSVPAASSEPGVSA